MTITRVKINTVDLNEQQAVSSCQIALVKAPNGNLWALYHDNDGGVDTDLYVAYSSDDGATWTEEEALAGGRPVLTGRTLALLVDSNSVPHIIFLGKNAADTFNGRIRYLNRVGGTWSAVETIVSGDASTSIGRISACIDSTNTIHIMAKATLGGNNYLYYWTGTSGSWSAAQTVDTAGNFPDVTVTSADLPICVYNDAGGIKFNTRNGGTWANEETVSTNTDNFGGNKIAIDSSNNVHVVWNEIFNGWTGIKYRKRTVTTWGTEQVVVDGLTNNVDSYGYPLFGLDTSNNAYVVYQYGESTTESETVWYKKIVSEVVGAETVLDSLATQPNTYPCTLAYLWHRFPSSGILAETESPACLLLDETVTAANVYFLQVVSATTYPTDNILRASGITRTFWAGSGGKATYQMQINLGGASTYYVSPLAGRQFPGLIPKEETILPGLTQEDYAKWLVTPGNIQDFLKIRGRFPTYQDWFDLMRLSR